MMLAHIMGIPLQESVLQLAPVGAAMVTAVWITARATLRRLRLRRPVWLGGSNARNEMATITKPDPGLLLRSRAWLGGHRHSVDGDNGEPFG
jgi:hypothetical protein